MPDLTPTELLRPNLLDGVGIVLAAGARTGLIDADGLRRLGADLRLLELPDCEEPRELESRIESAVGSIVDPAGTGALLVDGASLFGEGGEAGLGRCLACSWSAVRAVAGAAFLPEGRGGRIALVAPAAGADRSAAAAAGLENLARTLSIEWARFGVTTVAIAPGESTSGGELTTLAAYLSSPAGAYFSGCLLDLRGPAGRSG